MSDSRPNILLIQADQVAGSALPVYGHPVVKAPHLTRLGEQGVVFENAYCNSPLCSPSRFSMMAGQLPSRIAAYDNAAEFASDIPTFAHYLRSLGYHTALSGKMHFVGPDQLHGFEDRLTTDIYPSDFAWTPDWEHPDRILEWYHNMVSVVTAGVCETSVDLDFDEEVSFQANRKLFDLARTGIGQPFCLVVSFGHPHDPYIMPRDYWERYDPAEIDRPHVPPLSMADHDPHSRRLLTAFAIDEYDITDQHVRDARHGYYAALSYVDDKVGQLLKTLQAAGFADNTIVIFTSDHGDMLGERGLWYKMSFFEDSVRVPLMIHAPNRFAPHWVATPVSLVDLLPTFVEWAAPDQPFNYAAPIDGRTLNPSLLAEHHNSDDFIASEYLAEIAQGPCLMLRRGPYKYIASEPDPELLFNLKTDPRELDNLATKPEHAQTLQMFRGEAARCWNIADLRTQVIASQRRRRLVGQSLMKGKITPWDFQPTTDASQQYIRNTKELWELYRQARYPAVSAPPPRYKVERQANLPG